MITSIASLLIVTADDAAGRFAPSASIDVSALVLLASGRFSNSCSAILLPTGVRMLTKGAVAQDNVLVLVEHIRIDAQRRSIQILQEVNS